MSQGSEEFQNGGLFTHLNFPYSDLSHGHILTVRNRKLWIDSVGGENTDERSHHVSTPQPNSIPSSKLRLCH